MLFIGQIPEKCAYRRDLSCTRVDTQSVIGVVAVLLSWAALRHVFQIIIGVRQRDITDKIQTNVADVDLIKRKIFIDCAFVVLEYAKKQPQIKIILVCGFCGFAAYCGNIG